MGCQSSLTYYGGRGAAVDDSGASGTDAGTTDDPGIDTATPTTDETETDTTVTDGDADTDADSDADTDADTDTDTDADTDTDTDTDTGIPPGGLQDGTYSGTVHITYELKVPLIGGTSNCNGPVDLIVDQAAPTHILGELDCDWPILDVWAQITLGHVNGEVLGYVAGAVANGDTRGDASAGTFVWNESWSGTASGTTVTGAFQGGTFLIDEYDGSWEVDRVGP